MSSPKTRFFRPGEFLFREGAAANSMMLIRKGTVAIRISKGSAFVDLAKVYPNEVIGELAFFDRGNRNASAIALSEVEIAEIDFKPLDEMYKKVPPHLQSILNCVANRLREADETIRRLQKNLVNKKTGVMPPGENMPDPEKGQELEEVIGNSVLNDEKSEKPSDD